MNEIADDYKKGIKEYCKEYDVRKSPIYGKTKNTKKVSTKWKKVAKKTLTGCNIAIDIYNSHKLFHLLELGHKKIVMGRDTGGFVNGRHLEDKYQAENEKKIQNQIEKFVGDMKKMRLSQIITKK